LLEADTSNDTEHNGRSGRDAIEAVCQVMSGPDRSSIKLDDSIAGP
jgi:hypothetical protein